MAKLTGKHQDKIPGMGGYVNAGPDLQPKEPTPYLHDSPCDVPHPDKHQSGVGGPSDRNNNGVDDSQEQSCATSQRRQAPGDSWGLYFDCGITAAVL